MSKEEKNKIEYLVICIAEFADKFLVSYKNAYNYLKKYNALKFLSENYEIEHTLSIEDAIDDITLVARNNGGYLI